MSRRQLAELRGQYDKGPTFDALCNSKRASRGTWTWVLVAVGVVPGRRGCADTANQDRKDTTEMKPKLITAALVALALALGAGTRVSTC